MNIHPKNIQPKFISPKEITPSPIGLHDIRNGLVLDFPFNEGGNGYYKFDGVDDYFTGTIPAGTTIVTQQGTSTLTLSENRIDGTAGTLSYLELSNGSIYNFENGNLSDLSGNGNDLTNHGAIFHQTAIDQSNKEPYMYGDGVDDEVAIPSNPISGDFRIDIDLEYKHYGLMFLGGSGDQKVGRWSNKLFFRLVAGGQSNNSFLEPSDGRHTISITRESGVCKYLLDGEVQGTLFTENGTVDFTTLFHAGTQRWGGKIYGYRVYANGTLQTAYNMLRKNNDDTTLPDISGNGNDGVVDGALFRNQPSNGDIVGDVKRVNLGNLRALEFNTPSTDGGYAEYKDTASLPLGKVGQDFTIVNIVKPSFFDTNQRDFFAKGTGNNHPMYIHAVLHGGEKAIRAKQYDGTNNPYAASTIDDTVPHIVHAIKRDDKIELWIDGELKDTGNALTTDISNNENCQVRDNYRGVLASPKVYLRALSDEEIRNQYLIFKKNL